MLINVVIGLKVLRMEWMGVAFSIIGVILSLMDDQAKRVKGDYTDGEVMLANGINMASAFCGALYFIMNA